MDVGLKPNHLKSCVSYLFISLLIYISVFIFLHYDFLHGIRVNRLMPIIRLWVIFFVFVYFVIYFTLILFFRLFSQITFFFSFSGFISHFVEHLLLTLSMHLSLIFLSFLFLLWFCLWSSHYIIRQSHFIWDRKNLFSFLFWCSSFSFLFFVSFPVICRLSVAQKFHFSIAQSLGNFAVLAVFVGFSSLVSLRHFVKHLQHGHVYKEWATFSCKTGFMRWVRPINFFNKYK